MTSVARLWADEGENYAFDFVGEFFHLEGVQSYPNPVQSPGPMVMSVDASPAGQKFAFDHANILFAAINVERSAEAVSKLRRNADGAGRRDLALWSGVHIICKDTET
ncbi:LLM class flavin-dependent oxidoreductase [Pseudarthrobacter siccitolerans]